MRCCRKGLPAGVVVATAALLAFQACGPGASNSPPGEFIDSAGASVALELECEQELVLLDELIARRSEDTAFPSHRLIEAQVLRDVAAELCFAAQFQLALELIDDATGLLGNSQ